MSDIGVLIRKHTDFIHTLPTEVRIEALKAYDVGIDNVMCPVGGTTVREVEQVFRRVIHAYSANNNFNSRT